MTNNNNSSNNNNNNNPHRSSKRKRHHRCSVSSVSAASASSSVSSSSSPVMAGERQRHHDHYPYEDPNYDTNSTSEKLGNNNNSRSVFSGFWSDAELEDGENNKENNKSTSKNGNGNNDSKAGSGNHHHKSGKASIDYEGFYLTIGDTIFGVGVGDVVAMRNSTSHEETTTTRQRQHQLDESGSGGPSGPLSSEYTADTLSELASGYYENENTNANANTIGIANTNTHEKDAAGREIDAKDNTETKDPSDKESGDLAGGEAVATDASAPPEAAAASLKEAKVGDGLMLARVERIWQEKGRSSRGNGRVLFKARWFLKKEDVDSLPLGEITGPMSAGDFANKITEHDLVLSNQSDDNHVTTICDLVQVLYRNPNLDDEVPSYVLPTTYLCRYSLRIDDDPRVVVLPYTGENDDWGEMTVAALDSKKRSASESRRGKEKTGKGGFLHDLGSAKGGIKGRNGNKPKGKTTTTTTTEKDQQQHESSAYGMKRRRVGDFADEGIDEGTTEQRDIQVGRDHQVSVPVFVRADTGIVSRNPVRMWKPDKISQEGTDDYIELASKILTPYLREHRLTQEEPYAPFPTKRMEEHSKSLSWKRLPTLSSVSTVSSMTTYKTDALREFNVDALLRNLHVSNYDIRAAIAAVEASPMDYLIAWDLNEKTRFNAGFRRYSGSLRAIYKGMGNKALPEVIDYHYRFKIPDQFRRVQERKREQAIRMLECIETKRNLNAPIVVSNVVLGGHASAAPEKKKDGMDWTKTATSTVATSLEQRRVKAKELLLDVEAKLGRNKMMRVFEVFRNADETGIAQAKTNLLEIFRGHQDFQSRFLEFLPQQMRL